MFNINAENSIPNWLIALGLVLWFVSQVYQTPSVSDCAQACDGTWYHDGLNCWCEEE